MPPSVEELVVPPGEDAHLERVWAVKERIRRSDGALAQPRAYFEREYRRGTAYLLRTADDPPAVVAFAVVHDNGYLSLFGVAPGHRRQGLGSRLLGTLLDEHPVVDCHTRATNRAAVEFYRDAGFVVERRIDDYYGDGTDGVMLRFEREWRD